VSPSTAHRLLSMLVFRGFAIQDENRNYLPGPEIGVAPTTIVGVDRLRTIARPALEELRDSVGETAYLLVLNGQDVRFVLTVESSDYSKTDDRHGFVISAAQSVGGRAILSTLPTSKVREISQVALEHNYISWSALSGALRLARQRGYAYGVDEVEKGVATISVPLTTGKDMPSSALSLSCPSHRADALESQRVLSSLFAAKTKIDQACH